jgi:hypothetical protein
MHSIAFSIFRAYRDENLRGKRISRRRIVLAMRSDLARRLDRIDKNSGKKLYTIVGNGALSSLGEVDPEYYSVDSLKKLLNSSQYLGEEIIVILEYLFNMNIIVLDRHSKKFVKREINPAQRSIVILYSNHHYDSILLKNRDSRKYISLFAPGSSFIQFIMEEIGNTNKVEEI